MAEEVKEKPLIEAAFEKVAETIQGILDGGGGHGHEGHGFLGGWLSLHAWVEYVGDWMISRGLFLSVLYIPLLILATQLVPAFPALVWGWMLLAFPIVGPIVLIGGFWAAWVWYVQSNFIFSRTKPVLLEVKMPTDILKSPRAMELVLTGFWFRSSTTTFIDKYWMGGVLPYFALEMVSFGGEIHFYIWCSRANFKNIIEANMYAQYPEVEIVEVDDYAIRFHFDNQKHDAFVGDYMLESHTLKRFDPRVNAYPIKTYVDFELDKDPKEELKVEPFAQVLEALSNLNPGEQAWVQLVLRGHFSSSEYRELVQNEIKELRKQASVQPGKEGAPESDERKYGFPRPTWKQTELMRSMERNLTKLPYDIAGRMIFWGPKGNLRSPEYTAIRWIFRPYGDPNSQIYYRPRGGHNDFDYPWQDFRGIRYEHEIHRWLDMYRRRQAFYPPWQDKRNIMTVEEIATLWHPPSRTIQPPGLQRIPSAKAQAPANLPM